MAVTLAGTVNVCVPPSGPTSACVTDEESTSNGGTALTAVSGGTRKLT